jgi:hypothetical protein
MGPRILHSPFIVGDGEAVTYRVRLKLDGKTIDETELKISLFIDGYIFGRMSLYFSILILVPSGYINHVIQQSSIGL